MLDEDGIRGAEAHGHSLYGGSAWHRHVICAGAMGAELGKHDTAGYEAAEGTVAHEIAARFLAAPRVTDAMRKAEIAKSPVEVNWKRAPHHDVCFFVPVDAKMLTHIEEYVAWCLETPGDMYVETRVDFSPYTPIPNQGGTADCLVFASRTLTLTDLKYGTGVQVFAERNLQLLAYSLGAFLEWDFLYSFEKFVFRICQPRLGHFDVWEIERDDLLDWGEWAKERLALSWQPDAKRTPAEAACKFCKARGTCPTAMTITDRLADSTFEDMTVGAREVISASKRLMAPGYKPIKPHIPDMTTEQIGRLLEFRKVWEHHLDAAYDELVRRCVAGKEPLPVGWILAKGKSQRSVLSRAELYKVARANDIPILSLFETSLLSPAKLESLFVDSGIPHKKAVELLSPAIRIVDGKPTLALAGKGKTKVVDLADLSFEDTTASENL